ncbi:MAG TPA: heme NO-binding domain-containing protein [Candidatus Thermoplasmatota archaeon]|jgi:hypothetical protein|nr:heme NO-binding domain-containing protein [Candidatus Thermoplasmatota archaeon]
MHGIVFVELKKYVVARLGPDTWNQLLDHAGLPGKAYLPREVYPDAEAGKLVASASQLTGKPAGDILEDFGDFIAPDLLAMYGAQVNPAWKTLEVLEHTEETIHRMVRTKQEGASPPELRAERVGPDEVLVRYASPRRMCSLAKGIARGLGRHYQQVVVVREPKCMHKGDPECTIYVRVAR